MLKHKHKQIIMASYIKDLYGTCIDMWHNVDERP